jgi:hypothetical protein
LESLLHTLRRAIGLTIPFWVCLGAGAQQSVVASATTETLDQVPRVPGLTTLFRGTNAGISFSGIHTSSIGWYELATPGVSYTFTDHYSLDASGLVYLHRLVERSSVGPQPTNRLVLDAVDVGDTSISFHGNYHPHIFYDAASASLTAPTGNRSAGLGTGEVTFNFDNLMERYVRQAGFLVDLGVGDSSSLASNLVNQNYSSVGMLAHFQTGMTFWLLGRSYVQSIAYEELPLGRQTVYRVLNSPVGSNPPGGVGSNVITSTSASEDNGFITQAGIPLTDHLTLSGYYNRSLRQHLDTVAIGMTFVLRGMSRPRRLSMMDRALRAAAGLEDK